ncbi:MAG: HAD family hydrolase [Acidimicrobiia bacterium]|nr:HAD family hydrolase [Acidimicrobiia bacterium]MYC57753.1 HAD family hydrolase [Acidimicrobiia bacterium]MYG93436.1 HAD family hydrolase [Acidimicrobiia bacterium]MYI31302.1 HAD family hydrolase [Acidimicrobiia bacterium]
MIDTIGLDADDTLWHNESIFANYEDRMAQLVSTHLPGINFHDRLIDLERRNVRIFGYGIKGFVLSMIETAIEATEGRITSEEIHTIVGWAKEMHQHPVELLDGVAETIHELEINYRLVLITKGDLWNQETKIAASGLADHFDAIEIVAEKDEATYARIFTRHDIAVDRFVMVGNSIRSDIEPVIALGSHAVHIPYHLTWDLEQRINLSVDSVHPHYTELSNIRQLPTWLASQP